MQLEIVSPERILLSAKVSSVTVPGVNGMFQMLDNHAPIVSVLTEGEVRFEVIEDLPEETKQSFTKGTGSDLVLKITGGVMEMNNNKVIVLVD